jgi:hypothetical protein
MAKNHGTHLFDEEAKNRFDFFIKNSGMKILYKEADISWLKRCI